MTSTAEPRAHPPRRRRVSLFVDCSTAVVCAAGLVLSARGSSTPGHRGSAQSVAYCTAVTKLADGLGESASVHGQYRHLSLHQHVVSTLVGLAAKSVLQPTKSLVHIITLTLQHQKNPGINSKGAEQDANKIKDYCGIGG
jgi:hypothetical protein